MATTTQQINELYREIWSQMAATIATREDTLLMAMRNNQSQYADWAKTLATPEVPDYLKVQEGL